MKGSDSGIRAMVAPYAGISLAVFFAAMWISAVIVKGDWKLGEDTLSELGGSGPSEWIFNSGVIVSGVIGMVFAAGLEARFRDLGIYRIGSYVLAFASICLISVGLFPIDTGFPHGVATVMFFTSIALATMLLLMPFFSLAGAKGAPFIATIAALAVSFASFALTSLPFAEAVTVASLLAWSLVIGVWMIIGRAR